MSEVYQGHNRGGLINYLIIDDVKQLDIWGPRFEMTNFVDLEEHFRKYADNSSSAMENGNHRSHLIRNMHNSVTENTTFYSVVDWQKYRGEGIVGDRSPLERCMIDAGVPGVMLFIPTKVLLFTDMEVQTLRDHTGAQALFLSNILHKEGFSGHYRIIAGDQREENSRG